MALNSSWVPDESPQTLFAERCWLQGAIVTAVAYGISVALYFMSLYLLTRDGNQVKFSRRLPLLIYITLLFILGTVYTITVAAFTQMSFIDYRNYPGGPNAFETYIYPVPIGDVGRVALVLSNWLSDALVVWRVKVIYQTCWVPMWIVMFFPCLFLTGSAALGIAFLIQVLAKNPYDTTGINLTVPYLCLSLGLNVVLTIAIVVRLLRFRRYMISVLGPGYGSQYTSAASMIIESALPYSALCLTFVVLFGVGSAVSKVFLQSSSQFQVVATLLIVFRVAQGKAWTEDTTIQVMSIRGLNPSSSEDVKIVRNSSSRATDPGSENNPVYRLRRDTVCDKSRPNPSLQMVHELSSSASMMAVV